MNDIQGAADSEWRTDPSGRHQLRFFVEGRGTDAVSDEGHDTVDHVGSEFLAPPSGGAATAVLTRPVESVVRLTTAVLAPPAWTPADDRSGPASNHAEVSSGSVDPTLAPLVEFGDGGSRGDVPVIVGEFGPGPGHRRRKWPIVVGMLVLIAGLTTAGLVFLGKGAASADAGYLKTLQEQGLSGKFTSDANAIAHGHQVCRQLDTGGDQTGQSEDLVAVNFYCPTFADGFHVLETITVDGSISLLASSPNSTYPSITTSGAQCNGDNGYSDIQEGTQVLVKNGSGELVTSTVLGSGTGGRTFCTFSFSFDVTEGETSYVVSVSHRGDLRYTFAELKTTGIQMTLGD